MTKWTVMGLGTLTALGFSACEKPGQVHEGKAKIVRTYVNRRDEAGKAMVTDVELSLEGCNADLRMVTRGGGAFASCVEKKAAGSLVSVKVRGGRTRDGRRTSEIVAHKVAGALGASPKIEATTDRRRALVVLARWVQAAQCRCVSLVARCWRSRRAAKSAASATVRKTRMKLPRLMLLRRAKASASL